MGEGVIADLVPFPIDTARQSAEILRFKSNQEKRRRNVLFFQHIKNLRCPLWIGTIIERERKLVLTCSVSRHTIRFGQRIESFKVNQAGTLVDGQFAHAVSRSRLNAQD